MAYELYATLEIGPKATPEEIRRAYYQMVRKHPPEKDAEKFQQIRRAYETLSDEKTRRDYDALQEYGDEITGLFSQAMHLMEQGNWESAAARLKHLLLLSPGNQTALNNLGTCFLHAQRYDKANEVYQSLVREHPDVAAYQFNLGVSYFELAEDERTQKTGQPGYQTHDDLYIQARRHFVKAVELQPHNPEHYIAVARTFVEQGDFQQALQWAEKAAAARGTTDYHDFEALFWICLFQLRQGDLAAVERTAKRIADLLPDETDVKRFAAFRFARVGLELYESKAIEPSVTFLRLACGFDDSDADLRRMLEGASQTLDTCRAFDRLMNDEEVINPLKRLAAVCMALYFEETIENFDQVMEGIFQELDRYTMKEVLASVQRIRTAYPQVVDINPHVFGDMERIAGEHVAERGEPLKIQSLEATASLTDTPSKPWRVHPLARLLGWVKRLFRKSSG
jgi:tetratricopeptide (TPR) repeat protein